MRVLVTGGSGFIGSHIIDVLVEKGHSVRNLDLKPPTRSDVPYREGNIVDRAVLDEEVAKVDIVYHIGGFSNIDLVMGNPVEVIELNVLSTVYLLDACRKHRVRHFLYASSVFAYDRAGHLYTTSKAASERIIEDYGNLYGLPYTVLRFATVYGPRNRAADVIYLFTKAAKRDGVIEIHGDGRQIRNFTHVRDAAEGSVAAMGSDESLNTIVTVAAARSLTINDLAELVKEIINPRCCIVHRDSMRRMDYRGEVRDIDECHRRLHWKPRIEIEDGIREMGEAV